MNYNTLVISIDELWLKGKNRSMYMTTMRSHIKILLKAYHDEKFQLVNENQRLVATSETPFSSSCLDALEKVPGINAILPSRAIDTSEENIIEAAIEEMKSFDGKPLSFKVNTKRTNKRFPLSSMETSRLVGHHVLKTVENLTVDVKNPQVSLEIRIAGEKSYVSARNIRGVGGLPVGTSGHLVTMISGGFDSPVASYMMAKRGCKQTFVFFYAYPYVGEEVKDKIMSICSHLGKFQKGSKLYIVPFGKVQKKISETCKEEYRTLLFRKYMVQISNMIASKVGAQALLTGDSLGQVSSQTMENISAIERMSDIPIFRPLIGLNKFEIIETARKIGTHDLSVIPHDDACALFAPKSPVIRANKFYWEEFEKENDFSEVLEEAVDESEIYYINLQGNMKEIEREG